MKPISNTNTGLFRLSIIDFSGRVEVVDIDGVIIAFNVVEVEVVLEVVVSLIVVVDVVVTVVVIQGWQGPPQSIPSSPWF